MEGAVVKRVTDPDPLLMKRLKELEKEAFGEGGLDEWVLAPFIRHALVFTISLDGEVVGVSEWFRDWDEPEKAYLFGISIDRNYRDRGLGTILLKENLDYLASCGMKSVELTVDPRNERAVHIYKEKFGFIVTGYGRDEYGPGEDRLMLKLDLY